MTENKFKNLHSNNTEKVSDKWESYLDYYNEIFMPLKNKDISLLEIGIQNGGVIFLWSLFIIIILSVIEGREVSKLYFETGKVSAGDRFFSLKYILSSAFFVSFFRQYIGYSFPSSYFIKYEYPL